MSLLPSSDSIPSQELFNLLPPSQRKHFLSLIEHPESLEAKELLKHAADTDAADGTDPSMEFSGEPWWKVKEDLGGSDAEVCEEGEVEEGNRTRSDKGKGKAKQLASGKPKLLDEKLLNGMVIKPEVVSGLRYNIFAVG